MDAQRSGTMRCRNWPSAPVYNGATLFARGTRWLARLSLAVLVVSVTQVEFLAGPSQEIRSPSDLVPAS